MLFSTNYFGSIPYYQAVVRKEKIVIDIYEKYIKQTWRNRTQILSGNGILNLSVPVKRPFGNETLVKDIIIDNKEDWRSNHWKSIENSYRHAPYFYYYAPEIKDLICSKEELLFEYNTRIFRKILELLDLEIEFGFSKAVIPVNSRSDNRIALNVKKFNIQQKRYIQVFSDKFPFYPNLSVLDVLMNEGPLSRNYLAE